MRFIGDIHGKWIDYAKIIKGVENSVQIGDFGRGFFSKLEWDIPFPPKTKSEITVDEKMSKGNHRFIRGNHDNPAYCKMQSSYIEDGLIENDTMFIGGAWSIDQFHRTEGLNWWEDEELSYNELDKLVDVYMENKPKLMITHDCPSSVAQQLFIDEGRSLFPMQGLQKTRTGEAFESMFKGHAADVWIFGHWHYDIDQIINGTRFICLDELSYIDMDMEDLGKNNVIIPSYNYSS